MISLFARAQELQFLHQIAWWMIAFAIISFCLLKWQTAPYGRYATTASAWWGPNVPAKLAWFVQELPAFLWALYALCFGLHGDPVGTLLIGCFLLHYAQRTLVFPLLIRGGKPTKLVPFVMAIAFCFINGFLQTTYLSAHFVFDYSPASFTCLGIGLVLFFAGMAINIHADAILRNLRANTKDREHKIPYGGLFNHVSAANFFGEIVEWMGFAIATGCALPALAFAISTFANIGPRGKHHHDDYRNRFAEYPKNRKAVIPFLW